MMNMDQIPRNLPGTGMNLSNAGLPPLPDDPSFSSPVDGFSRNGQEPDYSLLQRPPGSGGDPGSVKTQWCPYNPNPYYPNPYNPNPYNPNPYNPYPVPPPTPDPLPTPDASWVWEKPTKHGSTWYSVMHPQGWIKQEDPRATFFKSPDDPNVCVSLMWPTGMGQMDPSTLLNNTVKANNLTDFQVLGCNGPTHYTNPDGSGFSTIDSDAVYTFNGKPCRCHISATVNDSNQYMAMWSGGIVWSQAPADKWDENSATLGSVSKSVRLVGAPPDTPYPWNAPPSL
jgi:hypothetical protein